LCADALVYYIINKLTNYVSTKFLWNVTLSLGEDRGAVIFKGQQSKISFDIKANA